MKDRKLFFYSRVLKLAVVLALFAATVTAVLSTIVIIYKEETYGSRELGSYELYMQTEDFSEEVSRDMEELLTALDEFYQLQSYKSITITNYDTTQVFSYNLNRFCEQYDMDLVEVLSEAETGEAETTSEQAADSYGRSDAKGVITDGDASVYDVYPDFAVETIYDATYTQRYMEDVYHNSERFICITAEQYLEIMQTYTIDNYKDIPMDEYSDYYVDKEYNNDPDTVKLYMDDEGHWRYSVVLNNAFGECMIYQNDSEIFAYLPEEGMYYNSYTGWFSQEELLSDGCIYMPADFVEDRSYANNKYEYDRAILVGPVFHSRESVVRCRYRTLELTSLLSIQNIMEEGSNQSVYYYIYFPTPKSMGYMQLTNMDSFIQYTNSEEPLPSEYIALMKNNFDTIVGLNITSDYTEEDSYYKEDGYLHEYGEFLDGSLFRGQWSLPAGTRVYIGYNIMTSDGEGYYFAKQLMFQLCQHYDLMRIGLIVSIFVIILSLVYLTWVSGRRVVKRTGEDGTENYISSEIIRTWFDRMPLEVLLVLIIAVAVVPFAFVGYSYRITEILQSFMAVPVLAGYAAVAFALLITTYLSVVKRCKEGVILKELLIVRFCDYMRIKIRSILDIVSGAGRRGWFEIFKYIGIILANVLLVSMFWLFMDTSALMAVVIFLAALAMDVFFMLPVIRYATGVDAILKGTSRIAAGEVDTKIPLDNLSGSCRDVGETVNSISEGMQKALEMSIRDERLKAELITNVSHDIKTPITSIINYVALMKREDISNPKIKEYLEVLEKKPHRLKQLTEDLVEASKASTGNITLECMNIDFGELLSQAVGEFEDKFLSRKLTLVKNIPDERIIIYADGRRVFRIVENLFQNIYKYAMPGTRIYMDIYTREPENKESGEKVSQTEDAAQAGVSYGGMAYIELKNISEAPLNISPEELTERFVRGDESRTTEGSGLGLSIAKNLTELHGGSFEIDIEGDLFKAIVGLPTGKPLVMEEDEDCPSEEEDEIHPDEGEDMIQDKEVIHPDEDDVVET